MPAFAPLNPNLPEIRQLVRAALAEDVGPRDVTSEALIPASLAACGTIFAMKPALSPVSLPADDLLPVDPDVFVKSLAIDGTRVRKGQKLAQVFGGARALLAGERTAVNFLQHLSGIATTTRRFVDAIGKNRCQILDTRKTLSGFPPARKIRGARGRRGQPPDGALRPVR